MEGAQAAFIDDGNRIEEHRVRFGRKTRDEVGAEGDVGAKAADALCEADRVGAAVTPLHALQDHVVAGL